MEADARIPYDFVVSSARAQLGDEAFEKAIQEGRAMSMEQAIEYALGDTSTDTDTDTDTIGSQP